MRRSFPRWLLIGFLALASLLAAQGSFAQPPKGDTKKEEPSKAALEEARARYQRATELYNEGNYPLALIEFQRAYELAPAYRILFNIGQVSYQLGRHADALRAFERFLDEGEEISAKQRAAVEREIATLRFRTARVMVIANVDGAEISINGDPVGKTPLSEPLLVDAGKHTIGAKVPGRISASEVVTLAGADEVQIEFDLPPEPAIVGPAGGTIRERETIIQAGDASYVWVGWLVTGALIAGTTGTGIAALAAESRLKDERDKDTTVDELKSRQEEARTLAIVTDVLAGCAVVAGAITLYFTIAEATEDSDEEEAAASLRLGVGPRGMVLDGSF